MIIKIYQKLYVIWMFVSSCYWYKLSGREIIEKAFSVSVARCVAFLAHAHWRRIQYQNRKEIGIIRAFVSILKITKEFLEEF